MRKVLVLMSLLTMMVLSSCKQELVYVIDINKHVVNFPSSGGTDEISVKANNPWDVFVSDGDESWIKTSVTHSEYIHASFNIIVESVNDTGAKREGSVYIKNGDALREIKVNQSFEVVDDLEIKASDVYGAWRLIECEKAPFMVGSEFNFGEDMNCTATLKMPTSDLSVNGVYRLDGNIVKIDSDGRVIDISINKITETSMSALVMGQYDSVLEKIK